MAAIGLAFWATTSNSATGWPGCPTLRLVMLVTDLADRIPGARVSDTAAGA
jgi:hypothetical protein